MKIWQKIKTKNNNNTITEYRFCGITLLHKEKTPIKKVWEFLALKITRKPIRELVFPANAQDVVYEKLPSSKCKRVAIFASFSANGKIADYVIYYLKELKKVCDAIVFVADNPIFPEEVEKIKNLVCFAKFERHKEYDFGSYKRGYEYAEEKGLLNNAEELVLLNDSCFGPVFPLKDIFDEMSDKKCDFWGLTSNTDFQYHLQSFFLVFKKSIIKSGALSEFLQTVEKQVSQWFVVVKYETKLTQFLQNKGYICASFVPDEISETNDLFNKHHNKDKTHFPLTLMKKYHFPLIKVKVLNGAFKNTLMEKPEDALDFIEKQNPELFADIRKRLKIK